MRPNVPEQVANDIDQIVDEVSSVDPDRLSFESKLQILIGNIGDYQLTFDDGVSTNTTVGEIVEKYD